MLEKEKVVTELTQIFKLVKSEFSAGYSAEFSFDRCLFLHSILQDLKVLFWVCGIPNNCIYRIDRYVRCEIERQFKYKNTFGFNDPNYIILNKKEIDEELNELFSLYDTFMKENENA